MKTTKGKYAGRFANRICGLHLDHPNFIAITCHEAAHAFAACKSGDDTALRLGRVTFNPIKHVDPFGTILLPAILFLTKAPFLFGWAKPVPVAFARLRRPRGTWLSTLWLGH